MTTPILLGLIAETPIHYGAETGGGAIDLPVAREAATHYPVISGSAFKGAFKDILGEDNICIRSVDGEGNQNGAGHLIFSDIRLILLPVRSLAGSYAWVTCPLLLERLQRDLLRAGTPATFDLPVIADGAYLGPDNLVDPLQLEERQFSKIAGSYEAAVTDAIKELITHSSTGARVTKQLVVLSDNDFAWFAQFALPVNAHNVLDENKTSKNLWYEETLPPDTVMYGLILPRPTLLEEKQAAAIHLIKARLNAKPYLQIGAGETTGLGWFAHNCRATPEREA